MDPTSLPTDNLYKFLALSGLALAGFCVWLKWKINHDELDLLHLLERDLDRLEALQVGYRRRVSRLENETKSVSERVGSEIKRVKEQLIKDEVPDGLPTTLMTMAGELIDTQTQASDELAKLEGLISAAELELADLKSRKNASKQRVSVITELTQRLSVGTVVGAIAATAGFVFWYSQLQLPLDRKLHLELEVQTMELEAKRDELRKAAKTIAKLPRPTSSAAAPSVSAPTPRPASSP